MLAVCKSIKVALRYAPLFVLASVVPAGAIAGPTATQVIEKAAVRALDLREEARFVKFEGRTYHLKAPTIIPLSPSGTLIEVQVSMVISANQDIQRYYRLQVDSAGRVMRMDLRQPVLGSQYTHKQEFDGLSLAGPLDGVLTRANHRKDGPHKLALGVGWAYVRSVQ